ncbi:hypothetical protein ACHQM5_030317 [Ranunculus cassubicifolius]
MVARTIRMSHAAQSSSTKVPAFPPGYRFEPKDAELLESYLNKKIADPNFKFYMITEENIYDYHPKELIHKYRSKGEEDWYFFTPRERKYKNGRRPNRAAANGYWKATGTEKKIVNKKRHEIGNRNSLVYYEGKAPSGIKTNWIMHEFLNKEHQIGVNHQNPSMELDKWVLCRIHYNHKKSGKNKEPEEEEKVMELVEQVKVETETSNNLEKGTGIVNYPLAPGFQNPVPLNMVGGNVLQNVDFCTEPFDWSFEDGVDAFSEVFGSQVNDGRVCGVGTSEEYCGEGMFSGVKEQSSSGSNGD